MVSKYCDNTILWLKYHRNVTSRSPPLFNNMVSGQVDSFVFGFPSVETVTVTKSFLRDGDSDTLNNTQNTP